MNLRPLPETIADITPEWLNAALNQFAKPLPAPMMIGARITSLDFEPLKNLGRPVLKAAAITKTDSGRRGSFDLLVKLHSPNVPPNKRPKSSGEAYFYKEVASRSRVPTPETYIAEFVENTGRLLIVQEFLTNGHIGTAETMLDADDQKRVLVSLARMHAHWWNSPELAQLHGIRSGKAEFQHGMELFESGVYDGKIFLSRFADQVHPVIANYYAASTPWGPKIRDGFSNQRHPMPLRLLRKKRVHSR